MKTENCRTSTLTAKKKKRKELFSKLFYTDKSGSTLENIQVTMKVPETHLYLSY